MDNNNLMVDNNHTDNTNHMVVVNNIINHILVNNIMVDNLEVVIMETIIKIINSIINLLFSSSNYGNYRGLRSEDP